ncbi:MAG: type II toxin-antitoxin system VapC family toxin [Bryobacteraceae bacterium]
MVLDASVAIKWYVVEESHEEGLSLLDADAPLLAPRIIEVEVASAIMARSRSGEIPPITRRSW